MAFRHPNGWLLTASPRRRPRRPFRRTIFPRAGAAPRERTGRAAPAAGGGRAAPAVPWWQPVLNALTALPARPRGAHAARDAAAVPRGVRPTSATHAEAREPWRPIVERLDRQREQLASMDGHLRRLVELQSDRATNTATYAPPA